MSIPLSSMLDPIPASICYQIDPGQSGQMFDAIARDISTNHKDAVF